MRRSGTRQRSRQGSAQPTRGAPRDGLDGENRDAILQPSGQHRPIYPSFRRGPRPVEKAVIPSDVLSASKTKKGKERPYRDAPSPRCDALGGKHVHRHVPETAVDSHVLRNSGDRTGPH